MKSRMCFCPDCEIEIRASMQMFGDHIRLDVRGAPLSVVQEFVDRGAEAYRNRSTLPEGQAARDMVAFLVARLGHVSTEH